MREFVRSGFATNSSSCHYVIVNLDEWTRGKNNEKTEELYQNFLVSLDTLKDTILKAETFKEKDIALQKFIDDNPLITSTGGYDSEPFHYCEACGYVSYDTIVCDLCGSINDYDKDYEDEDEDES